MWWVALAQAAIAVAVGTLLALVFLNYNIYSNYTGTEASHTVGGGALDKIIARAAENEGARVLSLPSDVRTPPITLLKSRWNVPARVAKELGTWRSQGTMWSALCRAYTIDVATHRCMCVRVCSFGDGFGDARFCYGLVCPQGGWCGCVR